MPDGRDPVRSRPLPTSPQFHIHIENFLVVPLRFVFICGFLRLIKNFGSPVLGLVLGIFLMY